MKDHYSCALFRKSLQSFTHFIWRTEVSFRMFVGCFELTANKDEAVCVSGPSASVTRAKVRQSVKEALTIPTFIGRYSIYALTSN